MFGLGAVVLLPVLIATGGPLLQSTSSVSIAAYLAIGPMFVAYVLFGLGLTHLRSTTATTITLLEPVVATILAILVVGERLEPLGWVGLLLILIGITVLVAARHNTKESRSF
jgi:DME family drug/metabolite transporter